MFNSNDKESPVTDADINTALRILIDYVPKLGKNEFKPIIIEYLLIPVFDLAYYKRDIRNRESVLRFDRGVRRELTDNTLNSIIQNLNNQFNNQFNNKFKNGDGELLKLDHATGEIEIFYDIDSIADINRGNTMNAGSTAIVDNKLCGVNVKKPVFDKKALCSGNLEQTANDKKALCSGKPINNKLCSGKPINNKLCSGNLEQTANDKKALCNGNGILGGDGIEEQKIDGYHFDRLYKLDISKKYSPIRCADFKLNTCRYNFGNKSKSLEEIITIIYDKLGIPNHMTTKGGDQNNNGNRDSSLYDFIMEAGGSNCSGINNIDLGNSIGITPNQLPNQPETLLSHNNYLMAKNDNTHNKLLIGISNNRVIEIDDYVYVGIDEIVNNVSFRKFIENIIEHQLDFSIIYKRLYRSFPYLKQHEEGIHTYFKLFFYNYLVKWIPCKVTGFNGDTILFDTLPYYLCGNNNIEILHKNGNTYNVMQREHKYLWVERQRQHDLYTAIGYDISWTYNDECVFINKLAGIPEFIINPYSKVCNNIIVKRQFIIEDELPLNINLTYQSVIRSAIPERYLEYIRKRNNVYNTSLVIGDDMNIDDYIVYNFMLESALLEEMGIDYNAWLHSDIRVKV